MCLCVFICAQLCVYASLCLSLCLFVFICVQLCVYASLCLSLCVSLSVQPRARVFVCVCVFVYVSFLITCCHSGVQQWPLGKLSQCLITRRLREPTPGSPRHRGGIRNGGECNKKVSPDKIKGLEMSAFSPPPPKLIVPSPSSTL